MFRCDGGVADSAVTRGSGSHSRSTYRVRPTAELPTEDRLVIPTADFACQVIARHEYETAVVALSIALCVFVAAGMCVRVDGSLAARDR